MSTLILDKVLSGYNLAKVNDNFERIEKAFNEALLHRDGSKELLDDLDVNSQKLLNVGGIEIGGVDIVESITSLQEEYNAYISTINEYKAAVDEILEEAISYGAVDQKSIGNAQRVFTTSQTYAVNSNMTLPLPYIVGKNTLKLNLGHYYELYKGVDYEEVGVVGNQSTTIKLLRIISSGVEIEEFVDGDNDLYSIYATAEALQELLTTSYSPESIEEFVNSVSDIQELGLEDKIAQLNSLYDSLVSFQTSLQTTVADINTKYSTITDMYEDVGTKYSLLATIYSQLLALINDTDFDLNTLGDVVEDLNTNVANLQELVPTIEGYKDDAQTAATSAESSASSASTSATSAANSASSAAGALTNAQIWAEGTDGQVESIGGEHSAKGWAEQARDYTVDAIEEALGYTPADNSTVVKHTAQSLTDVQKAQARTNIGAFNVGDGITATGSTTARTLANRFADIINVMDYGAKGDGVTDDTAAIQAAFDAAHAAGGGTVFFPAGKYKRPDSSARLFIYSNTRVLGVGDASVIYHYDTEANAANTLISSNVSVENIVFQDIQFLGTLDQFTSETNGSANIALEHCKNIRFENVTFEMLRKSAIGLYRCDGATVINCRFTDIQRDGVRCDKARNIQVIGNKFTRVADDPVAIHYETESSSGNIITQTSIVSGNVFNACQGIQLLGAKDTVIADNIFNRSLKRCIYIRNVPDSQATSALTGYVPQYNVQIVNNVMLDTFAAFNNVHDVIRVENGVANSTAGNTAGQESLNVSGQGSTSVPFDGLLIDGNVIGWTLPVGVNYSSYGYGLLLQRSGQGWFDLSCTDATFSCEGIHLEGAFKNARITNNKFSGQKPSSSVLPAINFRCDLNTPAKIMLENVVVENNSFYDWSNSRCISFFYDTAQDWSVDGLVINSNSFNLDPYFRNSGRVAGNKWNDQYDCVGMYITGGSSCLGEAKYNCFKNCSYPISSNALVIDENDVYFSPSGNGIGGQADNLGVRYIDAYRNYNCYVIDGDPTSVTFMKVGSVPLKMASAMPTSGTYVQGHFVKNAGVSTVVDGNVTKFIIGWKRLTTGSTHVLGTDWLEVISLTPDSVNAALGDKLSTSGGVMTGAITRSGNVAVAPDVTSQVTLCGGKSTVTGARLDLYGESHSSHSTEFILTCRSSALGYSSALQGKPDGSLLWNGQTVQTSSDERLKTPLDEVPDEVLDAWADVDWGQFQFLSAVEAKGESARQHLGLIAQRVKTVFETHGLDACQYGILCHEEHPERDWEEEDDKGNITRHHEDAVDIWMIRYEEALAMEAAYQRRRADRIESRLDAIEERMA